MSTEYFRAYMIFLAFLRDEKHKSIKPKPPAINKHYKINRRTCQKLRGFGNLRGI